MAKPKIYGAAARQRIDRTVRRVEGSIDGAPLPALPKGDGPLPRTYRRFKLTEQLDAGGSAEVEWLSDGSEGEVHDPDVCCWGLPGETGEAYAHATDEGNVEWWVSKNPGQGGYPATAHGDIYSGVTGPFDVDIDGNTVTVVAQLYGAIESDEVYENGKGVYLSHFRGKWYASSFVTCAEDAY